MIMSVDGYSTKSNLKRPRALYVEVWQFYLLQPLLFVYFQRELT